MGGPRLLVLITLGVWAARAAAQPVQGQVEAVGFQTRDGFVLRAGQWLPIVVSLRSQGSQPFAGELRVEGIDLDGDRVAFARPQVTVSAEAGPPRYVWCYTVVNAPNELPPNMAVIGPDGARQAELPLPPCGQMLCDDLLVLDISDAKVTALEALTTPGWSPGQRGDGVRPFYRNVVVATLPRGAKDLPDRWFGLEAVNVVVWDLPDPAALSIPQRDALLEWVRNGGQLIIGVGSIWGALSKSDLAPILPLAGEGTVKSIQKLDTFLRKMAWSDKSTPTLREPIAVTMAQPAVDAFWTHREYGPGNEPINLITMRLVGSGRVVVAAASLRDLTGAGVDPEKFFAALIDLNRYTKEFSEKELQTAQVSLFPLTWLYDDVVAPVGFGAATALRMLTAFLFVAAYVAVATLASWWWLRGRNLTHLSWTVFAGFAIVASALSLGTVSALAGFSRGVQSVNIIDLEAGSPAARGYCLFGYRSAVRQRVELALPGEGNFLRPLPRNPKGATFYVTPARYAALPAKATLDDVLMRATLKQVEGFWHGELSGTIRGQLVADRRTGRLTPASWLANDLGIEIAGGYLLFIDPRQQEGALGVPSRAAGLTTVYKLPESEGGMRDVEYVPPAVNILAVRVPKIPAGKQVSGLGQAEYENVDTNRAIWSRGPNRKRSGMPDLPTLWGEQQAWAGLATFAPLRTQRALLLASTRNYHLHSRGSDFNAVGTPISTEGLPDLDVTHWLIGGPEGGYALLLCWADGPGPARLLRDGKPLDAFGGLSVYRVRISVGYEGTPPQGGSAP